MSSCNIEMAYNPNQSKFIETDYELHSIKSLNKQLHNKASVPEAVN